MIESFRVALNAVVPFFCYLLFGYILRKVKAVSEEFLAKMNQFVFQAFFPIMMFRSVFEMNRGDGLSPRLMVFGVVSLLAVIGLLMVTVPLLVKENAKRGVLIQAIYRSNMVLFAIPMTESVFGREAAGLAAVMVAIIIPIYNVAAVLILGYFGGEIRGSLKMALKKILTNPLIEGAIVGAIFFFLRIPLPGSVLKAVDAVGDMTTPLAIIILGGSIHLSAIDKDLKYEVPALLMRLVVLPAIMLALSFPLGLSGFERFIIMIMYGAPVAVSTFPMAVNMNGDGKLAGDLVVLSTVFSILTLFVWISLLHANAWI